MKAQNGIPDWNQVEALIKEWKPDAVVVGLPLNMDGTPSDMCLRAEKFARRLNGRYNLPFYTCLLYTSPSPRDQRGSRMPSSA